VSSPRNLLLGFLALTTVGGAFLAWMQYGELVELRAAAMNRDERRDWEQRLADLEAKNRDLQARLAARSGRGDAAPDGSEGAESRPRGERSERGPRPDGRGGGPEFMRQQAAAIRDLMAKPEVQAMLSAQQKAALEERFGPLFKSLDLSPEQTQRLTALLAERGNIRRDIDEAARAQGINPRENPEAFRKLFTDAQNELNASIKSVIGERGLAQLQNYEQTLPQRMLVENLQQRLAATSVPLSSSQADQLVQILAANTPPRPAQSNNAGAPPMDLGFGRGPDGPGFGGGPGFGPPPGGADLGRMLGGLLGGPGPGGPGGPPGGAPGGAVVTPAAVAQAQTILAPPQVEALQRIQQTQAAQQQLQQLVRETLAATANATATSGQPATGRGPGPGGPPSGGTGGGAPPPRRPGGG
jgi:hypothetical protein